MQAKHILLLVTVLLVVTALFIHRRYENENQATALPTKSLTQNSGTVQSDSETGLTSL